MKKRIIGFIALLGFILSLTSCSFLLGKKIPMDSEEAIQTIKETIKNNANIGTGRIYDISWSEDGGSKKLKNHLDYFYIYWVTEDNSIYTQHFSKNDKGEFIADKPEKKRDNICYELVKPFDVDKLDAATILKQINDGKLLLGDEYEFASVENYSIQQNTLDMRFLNISRKKKMKEGKPVFELDPEEFGIQTIRFSLNAYKKGEDSKRNGRHVTTNYYTVPFIVSKDGSVQIREK